MSSRQISQLRAALVGFGFIGHVHLDALRRLGVQVVGVLGSTGERTAPLAAAAGIERVYRDLGELASDPDVDVVHVTSPNHAHATQALALLRAGKHLVCEKPLATTTAEAREMAAAARAADVVAAVCFHSRFYPMSAQVRGMIADGQVGAVRLVTGHYLQDWLARETDWNWRLDPGLGSATRAVSDIGSHWLDLVEYLTGERIEEVLADFATFIPVRKRPADRVRTFETAGDVAPGPGDTASDVTISTEDAALVLLRFAGGARGELAVSQVSPGRKNQLRYEIAGSSRSLGWESEHPEDLWVGHRDGPNEVLLRDPALMRAGTGGWLPGGHAEGLSDAFTAMFRSVYQAAAGSAGVPERPPYATFDDGLRGLAVEEAILSSARTGSWTKVGRS